MESCINRIIWAVVPSLVNSNFNVNIENGADANRHLLHYVFNQLRFPVRERNDTNYNLVRCKHYRKV